MKFGLAIFLQFLILTLNGCSESTTAMVNETIQTNGLPITFSNSMDGSNPTNKFNYPHKIYAFVTFPQSITSRHNLQAHWISPDGEIQENAFFQHNFSAVNAHRVYFWLQFNEPSSTEDSNLGPTITPRSANGSWSLKVYTDDVLVGSSTFTLSNAPLSAL